MSNPDLGNVPSQPQYGEVKQIEEQQAAAPMPTQESPAPSAAPAPVDMGEAPMARPGPSTRNIIDVLPSSATAPSNTGQRPLNPEEQLAYLILGTPQMSGLAKSFAKQIVGRFNPDARLSEQLLTGEQLASFRAAKIAEQMPSGDELPPEV